LPYFHQELKKPGVTRWVLWGEYKQLYPEGYGYSHFCLALQKYLVRDQSTMHFEHEPGDKLYFDFAGKKLSFVDKETGEVQEAEVFVAVLGYSQLSYVEAVNSQKQEDVIGACTRALAFFGGATKAIVCDNLKAAIDKPVRYEPIVNQTFDDFANHYGMVVLPARVRKPKDKPLVEKAVSIAYSRIYAPLRHRTFFSLRELNTAIKEHVCIHNETHFQKKNYSRLDLFEKEEKPLLTPLPQQPYELKFYKEVTVMKKSHVQFRTDHHYYSVPYRYIGEKVKIIYTSSDISIYHKGERIAFHLRDYRHHHYTTVKEHLPSHHQFVSEWNPDFFLSWAARIDPVVNLYILEIFKRKSHPEQAYQSCLGILSLARKVNKEELINACSKAHQLGVYGYTYIIRLLKNGYGKNSPFQPSNQTALPLHDNIRGAEYYQ